MIDPTLLTLAREYLFYVNAMRSGDYAGYALYELSSQRSGVYDELVRVMDDRPRDMQAWCRQLANETGQSRHKSEDA